MKLRQEKKNWQTLQMIRKKFKVSRNLAKAIYNKSGIGRMSHLDAYNELAKNNNLPKI